MTYVAGAPATSDSPGIFPAQAQANFGRLKLLLGNDHQFNDTFSANDGYHNLIHMTEQAPTGALAGVGRLYVKTVDGSIELFYRNDLGTESQITPESSISSFLITGHATIASGGFELVFPCPTYDYTGIAQVYIKDSSFISTESILRTGTASNTFALGATITLGTAFLGSPPDLYVTNTTGSTHDIYWAISISRTT